MAHHTQCILRVCRRSELAALRTPEPAKAQEEKLKRERLPAHGG
jgi:hypothetical protein